MYESFDHFKIRVVQTPSILGPYNDIDSDSATYSRVLAEATKVATKMSEGDDILWNYYETIGINPQDSFTDDLDNKIFEYLLRIALRPYKIHLYSFAIKENGMTDLDEIVFFIK